MFDGYAGPGWDGYGKVAVRRTMLLNGACNKVLKLQAGNKLHSQNRCLAPLWGADFKAASYGRGFFTAELENYVPRSWQRLIHYGN